MRVGSLFSGIGGFDLGLERAGMSTAWFCEQDEFCRRVLARHWPEVPCYPDVTELCGANVEPVDVLCGGFPCQDLSLAGKGAGIDGARSGLWSQFARLIGELRPRYVLVENVPALLGRGAGRVLGDLAALGYDAEWDCLPASAFGAPHQRDRFWLVAYPGGEGRRQDAGGAHGDEAPDAGRGAQDDHVAVGAGSQRLPAGGRDAAVADADGCGRIEGVEGVSSRQPDAPRGGRDVADPESDGRRQGRPRGSAGDGPHGQDESPARVAATDSLPSLRLAEPWGERGQWSVEPDVGRVADGVPARMDRLRSLGNALVPQIAQWIGERIVSYEAEVAASRERAA